MAISFTGTSTGNQYTVGQQYTANGNTYTAQADGSFRRDDRPGGGYQPGSQTLAGSSGNMDVTWSATGGDSLREHFASLGYPVQAAASSGSQRSENPGTSAAINAGAVPVQNPQVNRNRQTLGSFVQQAAAGWSGKDDPPQDLLFGGVHIKASPSFTNAELSEARYSDFMSSIIGIPIFGADLGNTVAYNVYGRETTKEERRELAQQGVKNFALDAGNAFVNAMLGTMGAIDQWGRDNAAYEQKVEEMRREREAFEARKDELQREEWERSVTNSRQNGQVIGNLFGSGG